jgi:predicted lipid-binding transport protein (Tim44 family)
MLVKYSIFAHIGHHIAGMTLSITIGEIYGYILSKSMLDFLMITAKTIGTQIHNIRDQKSSTNSYTAISAPNIYDNIVMETGHTSDETNVSIMLSVIFALTMSAKAMQDIHHGAAASIMAHSAHSGAISNVM